MLTVPELRAAAKALRVRAPPSANKDHVLKALQDVLEGGKSGEEERQVSSCGNGSRSWADALHSLGVLCLIAINSYMEPSLAKQIPVKSQMAYTP